MFVVRAVHRLSISAFQLTPVSRLRPGNLAAPGEDYLPLLPSGPDGIHSSPPRKTRPSTPLDRSSPGKQKPRTGIQPRYSGSRVQGTASSPSSTTHSHTTMASHTFQDYRPKLRRRISGSGNPASAIFFCVAPTSYSTR
jgi:hypothetical protein